jgi:HlyD family secretion protein
MKKWIFLVVVLGAGYFGFIQWRAWQAKTVAEDAPLRPTTAPVIVTNIDFAVNAAGTITPAEQVSVRPQVNGIIKTLPVDIGNHVKAGDLLFTLDDQDLQTEHSSKEIEIEAAQLQLEKAERDYKRAQDLLASKLISQETFDDTKTTYDLAKNTVEQKLKEQHLIEYQITLTKIVAPFDCTILTRPVSVGQAVSGSGGFNSGTEVLTVADLNAMVIDAHVNQADVPRLRLEQKVEITVEAVPGLELTGVVQRIAPQATIVNNIKGFDARILLQNVDPRVRPGMTANVRIPVATAAHVMAVPLAAVFTEKDPDSDNMERFVYVKEGDHFEKRDVQVGVSDYFYAEIQRGLTGNEIVSLEMPAAERDRQTKNLAVMKSGGIAATSHAGSGTNAPGARVAVATVVTNSPGATNTSRGVSSAGGAAAGAAQ